MSNENNPLGRRGHADEENWARRQNAKAIEDLKKKGGNEPAADAKGAARKTARKGTPAKQK